MRFVDTNVLLYAVSTAPDEQPKRQIALALLEADDLSLSVQVLQEFYVQATRASKPERLDHKRAALLNRVLPPVPRAGDHGAADAGSACRARALSD